MLTLNRHLLPWSEFNNEPNEPNLDCWYQHRKRNLALWLVLLLLTLYKRIPLSSDIQNKHLVVQRSHIYQLLANKHHAVLHLLVQKIQLANSCTKKVKLWYILLLDLDLQSVKKNIWDKFTKPN